VPDLNRAAALIVRDCLGVRPGEQVLLVTDPATEALALTLRAEAESAGAEAVLALMAERAEDGTEPPRTIAAALAAADAFLAPTARSLSHTQARRSATEAGVRGATLPGATADLLARVMDVDLERLRRRSRALAQLLTDADEARVTCPRGSDLRIDLGSRRGLSDDGDLSAAGAFGNLPCGEGFAAPAGGEGRALVSSLASLGLADEAVEITVEDGRIAAASGELGERFLAKLRAHGERGTNLAELGIGTNEAATLSGNILEDEKILGTVHVAFGASAAIGGTVAVPIHLDCVITEATLDVGGARVLDAGRFALDV
jgi:leucyl aminopeptidase (aminopeptidase T)